MTKQIDNNKTTLSNSNQALLLGEKSALTSFIGFWAFISDNVGNARLRINLNATSINDFIDASGDPKEYLITLIKTSYKRSRCFHLKAPININAVLDILGETAYELAKKQQDDLYDIEFLEEIAHLISERYSHCIQSLKTPDCKLQMTASVHSLENHKIRLNNAKL